MRATLPHRRSSDRFIHPGPPGQADLHAFPDFPRPATKDNIAAAREDLKDIYAFGQSRILPAFKKALAANPDEIIIATGKYGLEPDFVTSILAARKSSPVKIHTLSLGDSASPETLQSLADRANGRFKQIPLFELRQLAE